MIRIGILGSDNSHALHFAKICNLPNANGVYAYPDMRVVAIYGRDDAPEHTQSVATEADIAQIVQSPDELFGKVDAVMVLNRRGSFHVPEVLPFIEQGYPVFIDKPIASSLSDIALLRDAYEMYHPLISGGSTIKYCYDVLAAREFVCNLEGELRGGVLNFPADTESPYEGIYFYASHLIELMFGIFGYDAKSVLATQVAHNNFTAVVKYDNFPVVLNFLSASDYFITVYCSEHSFTSPLHLSASYQHGFANFAEMLHTQKSPLTFEEWVKPVAVIDAIDRSLKEKREILL